MFPRGKCSTREKTELCLREGKKIWNQKDYILCYMRERSKLDIEDYISSFYKDEEITAEQLDEIYAWLDRIYDDVIA